MIKEFEDFILEEYSHIVQAHFKSIETITSFFRYYLLIMSAIVIVPSVVHNITGNGSIEKVIEGSAPLVSIILVMISLIGVGVYCYVLNLRFDAILYARVVNGIRKFFYDEAGIDINYKLRMRALPQSPHLPRYVERSFFLPVVFVFAIINSFYACFPTYLVAKALSANSPISYICLSYPFLWILCMLLFVGFLLLNRISWLFVGVLIIATIATFAPQWITRPFIGLPLYEAHKVITIFLLFLNWTSLHVQIYYWYANHRETEYLRSHIIGVDIDGVLNNHKEQFCDILEKHLGHRPIEPHEITIYPIQEHPNLKIGDDTEETAKLAFNDPEYWQGMRVARNARKYLDRLQNVYKYDIHIFTYRPWPQRRDNCYTQFVQDIKEFTRVIEGYKKYLPVILLLRFLPDWTLFSVFFNKYREAPLAILTKKWLKDSGFQYKRFTLEKGSDNISDPIGKFNNRFFAARMKKIRFFVEDDVEKAIKLSYTCDAVFLISQPYNEFNKDLPVEINRLRTDLPTNIVRVKDWFEIYQLIRRIS